MSKRVMISGYYGFDNLGDELILETLVCWLKKRGFEPVVLSADPASTAGLYDVESIERTAVPQIWQKLNTVCALISGGGGLFQDVSGWGSVVYYGGIIEMAHWKKCPVAMFGQGVGPLNGWWGRLWFKRAAAHAQSIVLRDKTSVQLVEALTDNPVKQMADPVWLWPEEAGEVYQGLNVDEKKGIAVSLRPSPMLTDSSIEHLGACLAQWPNIQDKGVNLIECQPGMDILPLSRLEGLLKARNVPTTWFDQKNLRQGIATSEAMVGMRYHAVLLAVLLGLPVLSLSYDPKVQTLANQLGLEDYPVGQWSVLTTDDLCSSLRQANAQAVSRLQEEARFGFSLLKTWLKPHAS